MTNEREPLWSNERIADEIFRIKREKGWPLEAAVASMPHLIRDSYEARIAELEVALANVLAINRRNVEDAARIIKANQGGLVAHVSLGELGRRERRIVELEQKLSRAAQYKGAEAYPCPLCRYEDGIFVESCAMHNRIAELETQLAQTWQPVTIDGTVDYNGTWPTIPAEYAGDEIALCRLVERAEVQPYSHRNGEEVDHE